jgi:hypothetical protein
LRLRWRKHESIAVSAELLFFHPGPSGRGFRSGRPAVSEALTRSAATRSNLQSNTNVQGLSEPNEAEKLPAKGLVLYFSACFAQAVGRPSSWGQFRN